MNIHRLSCAAAWESLLKRRVYIASSSSQYDTDFYVLDKYPLAVRPFYTMPDPNNLVSLSHTRCRCCCFSTICIHTWYIAEGRNSFSIFTILSVVNFYGALWCICTVVCSNRDHPCLMLTLASYIWGDVPQSPQTLPLLLSFFVFFHSLLFTERLTRHLSFHRRAEVFQLLRHVHARGGDPVWSSESPRCSDAD